MNFKRKVQADGLTIITVPMKDNPTVTVLVMVEAGSKYETKKISGLSHFIEHMCFKGTTRRPTAFLISKELDSIGANYNAFTAEEYTGYYAKAAPQHAGKILDVISDLYLHPVFDQKEIEKEKGVIVEEINMYHDLPQRHVQELFMKVLYGDQPAGWGIAGTKETVRSFKREHFIRYRTTHYVAKATTVIVAGNFNEKNIVNSVKEKFKAVSRSVPPTKIKVKEKQTKPAVLIEERKTDQSHLVLGFRGFPVTDRRTPTLRVLNAVLGAGMSSRLFQKLREEMGVGYYVRSSYDTYTDHGIFSVSVGADVSRVHETLKAVLAECRRLIDEKVSDEELKKTKDYLIGTLYLGLESSDELAEFYGSQEMLNRPLRRPSQIIAEIQAVTAESIRKAATDLFQLARLNFAAVGPVKNDKKLRAVLKI
jgi:predicted Zn-dependent peptidase